MPSEPLRTGLPIAGARINTLQQVCMTINLYGHDGSIFDWTTSTLVCVVCGGTETIQVYPASESEAILAAISQAHGEKYHER